ncbi:hypothetical protein FACS1894103_2530 [Campylobacterota bacterium]|nr:hypothetical protein FACS1894103_2530 [Campylobacterota bacterium]
MEIKAYFRREERYEGLQLVYGTDESAKQAILDAIELLKEELGLEPQVMENCSLDHPEKCAIYVEFENDFDREGGEFFEMLMKRLDIQCCL